MEEMKRHVKEWFWRVDKEPHVYSVYFGNPASEKEFASFKADMSGHLKLLFCIDLLNEGVHVGDVSGVILLRPTAFPTLYLQQIGRSLSAGKAGHLDFYFYIYMIKFIYVMALFSSVLCVCYGIKKRYGLL